MPSSTMKLSRASPSSPYYSTTTTTTTTSATSSASASLLSSSSSTSTSTSTSSPSPSTRVPYSPSHTSSSPYSPSYSPSSYSSSPYITTPRRPPPTSAASALLRWARLKKYRIEVTYGVYVYTPVEKLVFWVLFGVLFVAVGGAALLWVARHAAALARALVGDGGDEGMLMMLGTAAVPVSTAEVVAGRV
ncbi:hypothetical protein F4809DRAFT_643140 [Biscogniauxia mediterranea]|nr:hypothetical protein F4809DRAFT_643140 [Biscogniauxia mediterranea]